MPPYSINLCCFYRGTNTVRTDVAQMLTHWKMMIGKGFMSRVFRMECVMLSSYYTGQPLAESFLGRNIGFVA